MTLFPKFEQDADFTSLSKLIYGLPKSGKSTLASMMTSQDNRPPLFVATEDGHGALSVHRARITSWDGFLRFVKVVKENQEQIKKEHSAFVFDLISDLEQMAAIYVQNQKDVEYIGDMDHGKGWTLHKNAFVNPMLELMAILPCTFITHTQEQTIKLPGGKEYKQQKPSLGKKCYDWVNGKVDMIMFITTNAEDQPVVNLINSQQAIAGSRYKQICKVYPYNHENPRMTYDAIAADFAAGVQDRPSIVNESKQEN